MKALKLIALFVAGISLIGCQKEETAKPGQRVAKGGGRIAMNDRDSLIAKIEAQGPPTFTHEIVVSLEDFFTGNTDRGSIGCNLGEKQPPISEFYRVLREIRSKPSVQDVLVRIYEYDDPTSWPFTDTVYIISSATLKDIETWVSPLMPDEVRPKWMYGKPVAAPEPKAGMVPYSVWWD